jgi:uncharacterized protein (TIGR03067 family)
LILSIEEIPLDGTWLPLDAELGGAPLPDDLIAAITLIIRAETYQVQSDHGRLVLDRERRPATMDLNGQEGPNQGRTIRAIYELTGDVLRICYELGSPERPLAFESEPGTLQFLVTYRRSDAP